MERSYYQHLQNNDDPYAAGYPGMGMEENRWFSVQGDVDDFIFYEPNPFDDFPRGYQGHSLR